MTSVDAREEILDRIRRTLTSPRPEVAPWSGTVGEASRVVDVDRFVERVSDYRAEVMRCEEADVEATLARLIESAGHVVAPEGLRWPLPASVVVGDRSNHELERVDAVITGATLGIEETGTIVLTHGPGEGRRAMTLVPDVHVCLIRAEQVVPDVPAAVARLDPARPTTWISGPSATSDIELKRVEGVHGPRTLQVIVVDR